MKKEKETDYVNKIVQGLTTLGNKYSTHHVFEDFLEMSALSVSNAVDLHQAEEREKRYMEIVKKYLPEEAETFAELFAFLVLALENYADAPEDVLGPIFHRLNLHNKYQGQFFTPNHICEFMGRMTLGDNGKVFEKKDYVTLCEPTCGSGAIVLGFAKALRREGYNFQTKVLVTAIDIDPKCVHMAYLQLSLFGIPAVVIHGNSLTLDYQSYWYTPAYIWGGWAFKSAQDESDLDTETAVPTPDITFQTDENGQYRIDFDAA